MEPQYRNLIYNRHPEKKDASGVAPGFPISVLLYKNGVAKIFRKFEKIGTYYLVA
jgi:hypothetical protein